MSQHQIIKVQQFIKVLRQIKVYDDKLNLYYKLKAVKNNRLNDLFLKHQMNQFYESQVYLHMIRSPKKSLQHCCTKECQLERISKNISFVDFEYCLRHSKMLEKFIKNNPLQQIYDEQQFQELCHIKNISNQQNKYYVHKALRQFQCFKVSVNFIESKRKEKYDKTNQLHENLLLQLWENLMPKQKLIDRISNQWIDIGFQVNDPATDFRGAGFLGLWNLVEFSRQKKCQGVFKWAIYKETAYFFCSAGLFLTMMGVELMKQMIVPVEHWLFQNQKQILSRFQLVYNMLFMQFDKFWRDCKDKSIMEFNNNLNGFKRMVKEWSPTGIKQKIIIWDQV